MLLEFFRTSSNALQIILYWLRISHKLVFILFNSFLKLPLNFFKIFGKTFKDFYCTLRIICVITIEIRLIKGTGIHKKNEDITIVKNIY